MDLSTTVDLYLSKFPFATDDRNVGAFVVKDAQVNIQEVKVGKNRKFFVTLPDKCPSLEAYEHASIRIGSRIYNGLCRVERRKLVIVLQPHQPSLLWPSMCADQHDIIG